MPSLGSDMEAGTLAEWLVEPGDTVARGDVIAVVETQKGAIEIETFDAGVVSALLAEVGQTLPVGAEMARIGLLINVIGIVVISLLFATLGTAVFSIEPGVLPDWALTASGSP